MTLTLSVSARRLVLDAAESVDSLDWTVVADAVVDALPPEQYQEVLRQVMPSYVRRIMNGQRGRGPIVPVTEAEPTVPALPATRPATPPAQPTAFVPPEPRRLSGRVAAVHADWQNRLRVEVYPGADGKNKRFGDMDRQDLLAFADRLRQHARSTMVRSAGFQSLADALLQHRVDTVADLPEDVTQRLIAKV